MHDIFVQLGRRRRRRRRRRRKLGKKQERCLFLHWQHATLFMHTHNLIKIENK